MNKDKLEQIIRQAMLRAKGDDLERANRAFGSLTHGQLKEQHGQSGKTKEEVWDGYKDDLNQWEEANRYLEQLLAPHVPLRYPDPTYEEQRDFIRATKCNYCAIRESMIAACPVCGDDVTISMGPGRTG